MLKGQTALITGASSGIGEATAWALARAGVNIALGARRIDRLTQLGNLIAGETGVEVFAAHLDVCNAESVREFVTRAKNKFPTLDILINNAGLAAGSDHILTAEESDWAQMLETNVMGLLRTTKAILPIMLENKRGHVINLGSLAGHVPYEGGAAYCGSKFAVRAITQTLRLEMLGKPIRVSSIDPGMVETEFSVVRFGGDRAKADAVYSGMTPLTAEDVAECILFVASRPPHVNIDEVILKPIDQAAIGKIARRDKF